MKKKTEKREGRDGLRREYDLSHLKAAFAGNTVRAIERKRIWYCSRRTSLRISLTNNPSIRRCVS
jgi:hypothetical protein